MKSKEHYKACEIHFWVYSVQIIFLQSAIRFSANRHCEISKVKGRSLLKIKFPSEKDDDTSKFPKTVFEISQKNPTTPYNQSFTRTTQDAPKFQENYI